MMLSKIDEKVKTPEMKTHWPTKKLGEICDILDSQRKPVTKRNRKPGPYHYYGATGVQDYVEDYIFDEPLVLVGEDGAKWGPGEETAYRVKGKYWVNNHAHVLRPHRDVLLDDWLVYFLNIADLSEYITGLTVKKLNQEKLRSIEIPLLPLSEQKRIVERIEKIFAKIDKAQKLRESALADSAAILPSALHQVFSRVEKERWEKKNIRETCDVIAGQSPEGLFYNKSGNGMPFYQGKKEFTEKFIGAPTTWTTKITKEAQIGDILISVRAPVGPVNFNTQKICIGRGLAAIRPTERINREYLFYYLRRFEKEIVGNAGAVFSSISKTQIENIIIPVPSITEQKKIVAHLDAVSEEARRLQELQKSQLADFSALRQSVLHLAFQGELVK